MTILQQNPTKLILQFRPWYIWIFGGIFSLVWLPYILNIFSSVTQSNTFTCNRVPPNQGTCELVTTNFLIPITKTIPLPELQGARVDRTTNNDGSQNQQVILLTKQGEIPFGFTRTYHPDTTVRELNYLSSQINDFVKNSQEPSLSLQKGSPVFGWLVSGVMSINFLWFVFCSEVVTCDFDKSRGYIIKKRQWFWFITKIVEYPLSDIIDLKIEEKQQRNGKSYRVTLLLTAGKDLPLTAYYTNYWKKRKTTEETAEAITKFLNRQKIYPQD